MHRRLFHAQQNERDQRDASDTVSLESIGRWPDRIARVVARAIGDHARVPRIIFLNLEYDLHQIRADVGDLGENSAGNSQRCRSQRLADGKSNKAWSRVITRNEQQDEQHD